MQKELVEGKIEWIYQINSRAWRQVPMDNLPVFCDVDDFCKLFEPRWQQKLLAIAPRQRDRERFARFDGPRPSIVDTDHSPDE